MMEAQKGTLSPGMLADLAMLSQDIFTVPPDALPATVSVLTLVGGTVVYELKDGVKTLPSRLGGHGHALRARVLPRPQGERQPIANAFGPAVSPMSSEWSVTCVTGTNLSRWPCILKCEF